MDKEFKVDYDPFIWDKEKVQKVTIQYGDKYLDASTCTFVEATNDNTTFTITPLADPPSKSIYHKCCTIKSSKGYLKWTENAKDEEDAEEDGKEDDAPKEAEDDPSSVEFVEVEDADAVGNQFVFNLYEHVVRHPHPDMCYSAHMLAERGICSFSFWDYGMHVMRFCVKF